MTLHGQSVTLHDIKESDVDDLAKEPDLKFGKLSQVAEQSLCLWPLFLLEWCMHVCLYASFGWMDVYSG